MSPEFVYNGVKYDFHRDEVLKASLLLSMRKGKIYSISDTIKEAEESVCRGETIGVVVATWAAAYDYYLEQLNLELDM